MQKHLFNYSTTCWQSKYRQQSHAMETDLQILLNKDATKKIAPKQQQQKNHLF